MTQPTPPQCLRFGCARCAYRSLDLGNLVRHVYTVHAYSVEAAIRGPLIVAKETHHDQL